MLHEEKQYPTVAPHIPPNSQMEMLSSLISEETDAVIEFSLVGRPFNASFLTIVADWDMDQVHTLCLMLMYCSYFFTNALSTLVSALNIFISVLVHISPYASITFLFWFLFFTP